MLSESKNINSSLNTIFDVNRKRLSNSINALIK